MKTHIKELKQLLKRASKAQVAVWCGVKDTRTIDQWITRKAVPVKYHNFINERLGE